MTLHGLILAGGRSTRMRQDKAAIVYHGLPQAQHLARLLATLVERVSVSLRQEQLGDAAFAGLAHITDHYAAASPLNGIASALRAHPGEALLVVAVDMPAVTPDALLTLIARRDASRLATCFESPAKGGPDPLLAIWEAHALPLLEQALSSDAIPCPRQFLTRHGARCLQQAVAANVLENINTPDELRHWQREAS